MGNRLGILPTARFGEDDLGWVGQMMDHSIRTLQDLAQHIESKLGRRPLLIGNAEQLLGQVAWCTGAAQNMLDQAIDAGASVFLSGEISEPTVHLARESGVAYLACGHHATERYGVQALGEYIAKEFGLEHHFIDVDNPV